MSSVVNMQQRRTVASGRQNQDPNKHVAPKGEQVAKKMGVDVERNIQEVVSHKGNTTGRNRQMVLGHLERQAAEERNPTAMNKLLGGSAKTGGYPEIAHSVVAPYELIGNKLSISDIRKRRLDQEESRTLSPTPNGCVQEEPKSYRTDLTPGKTSLKVYTKKQKTGTTPPTPPLRSLGRRRVAVAPPSLPPTPASVSVPNSPELENDKVSSTELEVELVAELDSLQPVKRQLMSPSTAEESDPYGFASVRDSVENENALVLWKEPDSQDQGVENQGASYCFIPQSPRKSHGLMNLGNTCYMNVIIQCLYNLNSFVSGMERFFGPLVKQIDLEDSELLISSDVETVHAALLKVFRDLKRAERYEVVNPSVLKHMFARHQESFWGCMQQDAHEFFSSLIDQVQEDVSSELRKQYSTEADRPKLEDVCPTTQNFSCSVRNNLTCAGCGNVSSVEETYRDFCLAFPEDERVDESQNCSLEFLLDRYFQETSMSRKCEKCGVEDTKAQAQFHKLPHVLVLQLKRLHMDRDVPCTKVAVPVKFTSVLDIGPWCSKDKQKFWSPELDDVKDSECHETTPTTHIPQNGGLNFGLPSCFEFESPEPNTTLKERSSSPDMSTSYRLHAVVNHLGFNASGGHFLVDVFDGEAGRWLRCDDSLVTDTSEESVFANVREAYMFFYVHESVAEEVLR
ncbi:hypothetical protein M758_3G240300 [Ceratodon purpureus]|nr:hypothetical protein M758_3G240300 [Ceratodon purpureus]